MNSCSGSYELCNTCLFSLNVVIEGYTRAAYTVNVMQSILMLFSYISELCSSVFCTTGKRNSQLNKCETYDFLGIRDHIYFKGPWPQFKQSHVGSLAPWGQLFYLMDNAPNNKAVY